MTLAASSAPFSRKTCSEVRRGATAVRVIWLWMPPVLEDSTSSGDGGRAAVDIAVDIGGTFTDVVMTQADGSLRSPKV
jgi:hypothetical protein